jgi:hypothetical protein
MRRIILTAVAAGALAVPGAALASHNDEQHGHELHHGDRVAHHHRDRRVRVVDFGEPAGTVASFADGKLAIALNDGTTVSAKLTAGTEIECRTAIAAAARDGGQGAGGDQGDERSDQGDERGDGAQSSSGPGSGRQDAGRGDDGRDEDGRDDGAEDEAEHCSPTALVTGAVVREAELSVSSAGAVWREVELSR